MRLEKEKPITATEVAIESILTESGISQNEIQFRGDERYLRIGYWSKLSHEAKEMLGNLIQDEIDFFDDDCGWLFHYTVRSNG